MIFTSLITALTFVLYLALVPLVGKARGKHHIFAPATTGHPDFERWYRTQQNTLEQIILFLPSLWLFEFYWVPQVRLGIPWSASHVSAVLGAVWLLARIMYVYAYVHARPWRGSVFLVSLFVTAVLLFWALAGIFYVLFHMHAA